MRESMEQVESLEAPLVLARGHFQPLIGENNYTFFDDTDDLGDCVDSVPAVILSRSEFDRLAAQLSLGTSQEAHARKEGQAHPDDQAVDRFAAAMKAKLARAREKGRSGWENPARCTNEFLAELLIGHLGKSNEGNLEDIANLAMMLYCRGAHPKVLAQAAMSYGRRVI